MDAGWLLFMTYQNIPSLFYYQIIKREREAQVASGRICLPPQDIQEMWVWFPGQEYPLEEEMASHSSILALENPRGLRSLVGYSPWGCKELDTTEWQSIAHHV